MHRNAITAQQIVDADTAVTTNSATAAQLILLASLSTLETEAAKELVHTGGGNCSLVQIWEGRAQLQLQREDASYIGYYWLGAVQGVYQARADVYTLPRDASGPQFSITAHERAGVATIGHLTARAGGFSLATLEHVGLLTKQPAEILRYARLVNAVFQAKRRAE